MRDRHECGIPYLLAEMVRLSVAIIEYIEPWRPPKSERDRHLSGYIPALINWVNSVAQIYQGARSREAIMRYCRARIWRAVVEILWACTTLGSGNFCRGGEVE